MASFGVEATYNTADDCGNHFNGSWTHLDEADDGDGGSTESLAGNHFEVVEVC